MALVHHELCFGCGRTNLFGLLLEVELTAAGSVAGRCFIKQDHQGARRGNAHEGVVTAALSDAMAFACGGSARARTIEVELVGQAPVGAFLEIDAHMDGAEGGVMRASASAIAEGRPVARASGTYVV